MKRYGLGFNPYSGEYMLSQHEDPRDERGRVAFIGIESLLKEIPSHIKRGKPVEIRVSADFPHAVLDKVKEALGKGYKAHYVFLDPFGNPRPSIDLIPDSE